MLSLNGQSVGTAIKGSGEVVVYPQVESRWSVSIFHRSGGLKKKWDLSQDNSPIVSIKFEKNKSGCGAGDIEFAYVDFPIDADDYAIVYYKLKPIWRGIAETIEDVKGGTFNFIPFTQRYEEVLYNNRFSGTLTIKEIISTIVAAKEEDTGIIYDPYSIDTGDKELPLEAATEDKYESVKSILDGLLEKLEDRVWGVDENNVFFVRTMKDDVSQTLFYTDQPAFSSIEVKKDYSNIKATRYQVFKKIDGNSTRIGHVGYPEADPPAEENPYPPLPIENICRKKEDKYDVGYENMSNDDALNYAYEVLKAQTVKVNITVKDIDLDRFIPEVGKYIRIQDREDLVLRTVVSCDDLTGWINGKLDPDDYVEGTSSVYFTMRNDGNYMEYNFGQQIFFFHIAKIGFMIKSDYSGNFIKFKIYSGNDRSAGAWSCGGFNKGKASEGELFSETSKIKEYEFPVLIPHGGSWYYVEFDFDNKQSINKIRWEVPETIPISGKLKIDRVQVLQYYRQEYMDNIVQVDYEITPGGESIEMKLNEYDLFANDKLFEMDKKFQILDATTKSGGA